MTCRSGSPGPFCHARRSVAPVAATRRLARILHIALTWPSGPLNQGDSMLHGDVQDKHQKMDRLRGKPRRIWTHPLFLGGLALMLVAYIATYW